MLKVNRKAYGLTKTRPYGWCRSPYGDRPYFVNRFQVIDWGRYSYGQYSVIDRKDNYELAVGNNYSELNNYASELNDLWLEVSA